MKTKGTQMYVRIINTSGGYEIVKIECPTGITGLGGAAAQVDDTCLDDEEMSYSAGMPNPGQVQMPINFDPSLESHRLLRSLYNSQDTVLWIVGDSDGKNIPPTVSGGGTVTYPTTRTYHSFFGYVADAPLDFAINANVKSNISIQRSGAVTDHYKA